MNKNKILISLIVLSSIMKINAQWVGTNPVATTSNVGIGTGYGGVGLITPIEKLTIGEMGGNFAVQDKRTSTTEKYLSGYKFYDFYGESASILLEHNGYFGNSARALKFFVNGYESVLINSNGNVGIGTNSPMYKLDINGVAKVKENLFISGSSGGYTTGDNPILYFGVSSDFSKISCPFGDKMILSSYHGYTFNTSYNGATPIPALTIGISGNVGIGITNPTNKLDINGTIHSKEVKVDMNGWSDFVFKKEYNLPTLQEVEKHINEKGHLENIPSEEEVLKNGINLGEMNAKLLQKIEEITLYMIEMQKENELQKNLLKIQDEKILQLDKKINQILK
jgi:hypothetical protein